MVRFGSADAAPWQSAVLRHLAAVAEPVAAIDGPAPMVDPAPGPLPRLAAAPGLEEALRRLAPDFALDLSDEPPAPPLRLLPRHGCWVIRDDEGAPPSSIGHHALARGERLAVVRLLQLSAEADRGLLLEEIAVKAIRHSPRATRARALADIAREPARLARRIGCGASLRPGEAQWCAARPTGAASVSVLARLRNLAARIRAEGFEDQWTIGVIDAPVGEVVARFDPARIRWLAEVEGGYLADPMVAPEGGASGEAGLIVLAEAYWFADRQGRIVALQLQPDGQLAARREVLRLPHHISYPHLIEQQGRLYCLPEANASGRVQLFRADPFPDRWLPDRVLIDGFFGVDPTLVRHGGRWWLFACDQRDACETKLFVFHSAELFGPWHAHLGNPVKTDVRSSRPAGPLFEHAGALFRPAQDCSRTYGGAISVNRIAHLSPEDFVEVTVAHLAPDAAGPYPDGMHTLSAAGDVTIIDGKRRVWSWRRLAGENLRLARARWGKKVL